MNRTERASANADAMIDGLRSQVEMGRAAMRPNDPGAEFMARRQAIIDRLDALRIIAADDHFGVDPDSIHWGHVGTLGHINRVLGDLLAFASPVESEGL